MSYHAARPGALTPMHRDATKAAVLLVLLATPVWALEPGVRGTAGDVATASAIPDLHKMLMGKFDSMNTKGEGIFHEDITSSLAAYFPVGQPKAETEKIIAAQKLGVLKPFKGANDPGMGTMFVSRFDLTSHLFSHVYVVLDFDFDGARSNMTLKQMKAYLRASNM